MKIIGSSFRPCGVCVFQWLRGAGCPYIATTTVRSKLFSDHTPIAVLAQSRMIAIVVGVVVPLLNQFEVADG